MLRRKKTGQKGEKAGQEIKGLEEIKVSYRRKLRNKTGRSQKIESKIKQKLTESLWGSRSRKKAKSSR